MTTFHNILYRAFPHWIAPPLSAIVPAKTSLDLIAEKLEEINEVRTQEILQSIFIAGEIAKIDKIMAQLRSFYNAEMNGQLGTPTTNGD